MNISGVIHRRAVLSHEDQRRKLFSIFNGDLSGFTAAQIKWFDFKTKAWVGNHYHHFAEIFCVIHGSGVYDFVNVNNPQQREIFEMVDGDLVLVPAYVAHRALVQQGSLIISANSEPYVSPKANDFPFDFNIGLENLKADSPNHLLTEEETLAKKLGDGCQTVCKFSEGLAAVCCYNSWFHIWPNGRPLYQERYTWVGGFKKGQAKAILKDADGNVENFFIRPDGSRVE